MARELRLIASHILRAHSPSHFALGPTPRASSCASNPGRRNRATGPSSHERRKYLYLYPVLVTRQILTRAEMASTGDASTEASTSDREYVSPGVIGACLTIIPNALMWYGAIKGKGKLEAFVKAVVKSPVGPVGLLAVPFCGMAMEKCFYDTLVSLQGVNPNIQPDTRKMETWPAGGHALPSFSVVPVKHIREYF